MVIPFNKEFIKWFYLMRETTILVLEFCWTPALVAEVQQTEDCLSDTFASTGADNDGSAYFDRRLLYSNTGWQPHHKRFDVGE